MIDVKYQNVILLGRIPKENYNMSELITKNKKCNSLLNFILAVNSDII